MQNTQDYMRRQEQVRRTLLVIDMLAPLRQGVLVTELQAMLREREIQVSERTVKRDLYLLHSMQLVSRRKVPLHRTTGVRWTLRLRESANLQKAAIVTEAS